MVPYLEMGGSDRKSVVQGKSVDLGGRRIIKKKNRDKNKQTYDKNTLTPHRAMSQKIGH